MWTQFPPDPCHTHTQRSQEHSAQFLQRCKWFACMHHWPSAAPSPPLTPLPAPSWLRASELHLALPSLLLHFLSPVPSSSSSPIICLFVLCSWYFFFKLVICFLSASPALRLSVTHPDECVILLHYTQPSLPVFDNSSFDSFPLVFSGWQRLRAGSHAVIIKSMSTVKPQSLQVIKTLQLRVTSSQSLVFSCPTFWL